MKTLLLPVLLTAASLFYTPANLKAQSQHSDLFDIQLAEEYKDSHFGRAYNSYQYVGTHAGQHYYSGEFHEINHPFPHAIRQIYLRLNADLSGEMEEYTDQKEGPDYKDTELKSLSLFGFQEGKILQIYQDVEGENDRFGLYKHQVLPNGEMGQVEPLVKKSYVAPNLDFTWQYVRSDDGKHVLIYGFSGVEESRSRTYNLAHLVLTDEDFNVKEAFNINFSEFPRNGVFDHFVLQNSQDIYISVYESRKGKSKEDPYNYSLLKVDPTDKSVSNIDFNAENRNLSNIDAYDLNNGNVLMGGIYLDESGDMKGVFSKVINPQGKTVEKPQYSPFADEKIEEKTAAGRTSGFGKLTNFLSAASSLSKNLVLHKVEELKDSSRYLIFENYYYERYIYQGFWKHFYHYNDKIVVKQNPAGAVEWTRLIPLKNTVVLSHLGGMQVRLINNDLVLFYPDDGDNREYWNGEEDEIESYTGYMQPGEEIVTAVVKITPAGEMTFSQLEDEALEDAYFMPGNLKVDPKDASKVHSIWVDQSGLKNYLHTGVIDFK